MTSCHTEEMMRWTENRHEYSDNVTNHGWRTNRRYLSAEDAVDQYLRLQGELRGSPAIDYEEAVGVDTTPSKDSPASLKANESFFLEKIFTRARAKVSSYEWRVWGAVRIDYETLREAARLERAKRRDEIQALHHLSELKEWCVYYGRPFPASAEDPWDVMMDDPGIAKDTAKAYRDEVDSKIEQQLVGNDALVRSSVREKAEARVIQDHEREELEI